MCQYRFLKLSSGRAVCEVKIDKKQRCRQAEQIAQLVTRYLKLI